MTGKIDESSFIKSVDDWMERLTDGHFSEQSVFFLQEVPALIQQCGDLINKKGAISQNLLDAKNELEDLILVFDRSDFERDPFLDQGTFHPIYQYKPMLVIVAEKGLNRKRAKSSCSSSELGVVFLEESRNKTLSSSQLAKILRLKKNRFSELREAIVENEELSTLLRNSFSLKLISEKGNETLTLQYRFLLEVSNTAKILREVVGYRGIEGFLLKTLKETFGFRIRNRSIELFDSSGAVDTQSSAYIAEFARNEQGIRAIAQFIHDRLGNLMEKDEYRQIEIAPLVYLD